MDQIVTEILFFGSLCTAIAAIWTLVVKMIKPFKDLENRVKTIEETVNTNKDKLINDNERLVNQEMVNQMLLKGVNTLIQHELTANHTEGMKVCSKEIEDLIYSKGGSL